VSVLTIRTLDHLDQAECWRLLQNAHLGRLATAFDGRVDIIPLHYMVDGESLLFRCAAESRFGEYSERHDVAFEIDGEDSRWYWAVTVHGKAERLVGDDAIRESGAMKLISWSPTNRFDFVRLVPEGLTGARVDRHEFRRSSMVA
jgi:nitroimidazol reductase NimA-like FMN-containing flavoprotein (pyridoxamine 5'-phosphate oxidase superfamily)